MLKARNSALIKGDQVEGLHWIHFCRGYNPYLPITHSGIDELDSSLHLIQKAEGQAAVRSCLSALIFQLVHRRMRR